MRRLIPYTLYLLPIRIVVDHLSTTKNAVKNRPVSERVCIRFSETRRSSEHSEIIFDRTVEYWSRARISVSYNFYKKVTLQDATTDRHRRNAKFYETTKPHI